MRRRIMPVVAVIALGGFSGFHLLFSTGIVGVTRKPNHVFAEPGCFCHSDTASARVRVWIEGPESLGAAQPHLYRILVARDSSIGAGFNVASQYGALGVAETSATQLLPPTPTDAPELTHIAHRQADGHDTIAWSFWYRAPLAAGMVDTIFAAGNSVDNSGDPSGDEWAFAPEFTVYVVPPSSAGPAPVAATYRLLGNYPNPFNPRTTIVFELSQSGHALLEVYDASGRKVSTPLDRDLGAGSHAVAFPADEETMSLASGVYLCVLTVRDSEHGPPGTRAVRKMLLVR